MGRFEETLDVLKSHSQQTDGIVVAYSCGKDSLATLDLCVRSFKHVETFFMYLVPGLECIEKQLAEMTARYGIVPRQYPHWVLHKALVNGAYCPNHYSADALPEYKLKHIYQLAMFDAGVPVLATGAKSVDSLWRRRQLANWSMAEMGVITPIKEWSKHDVLGYLKMRNLPIPSSTNQNASGIDLTKASLRRRAF